MQLSQFRESHHTINRSGIGFLPKVAWLPHLLEVDVAAGRTYYNAYTLHFAGTDDV